MSEPTPELPVTDPAVDLSALDVPVVADAVTTVPNDDPEVEAAQRQAALEAIPAAPAIVDDRPVPNEHAEGYSSNGQIYCGKCNLPWPCPSAA